MIRNNVFKTNAGRFITKEMVFEGNTIIQKDIDAGTRTIKIVYIGKGVNPAVLENAKKKLVDYHLVNTDLRIKQGMKELSISDISTMKSQIIEELYKKNQEFLISKDAQINLLEKELERYQSGFYSGTIFNELKALYPQIDEASLSRTLLRRAKTSSSDTVDLVYLKFSRSMRRDDIRRIEAWLHQRLPGDNIKIIIGK